MKKLLLFLIISVTFSTNLFSQPVTIFGKNIRVNNSDYIIRGVCYNPVAKGNDRFDAMDFSHIDQDILLMTQAKINTIRTYVPINDINILNKFAASGIKIIIGFPNYDDTFQYPDINHGTYLTYINTYKNHNAILMWELGNEYNYHPEWFGNNINNWYSILNSAALAIRTADPNHPVSTAHGEVPTTSVLNACPNVDVWGMNVYRWDNPEGAITDFAAKSGKPCYFSEAGGDRYNNTLSSENQQEQANANMSIWNKIKVNFDKCSGITYFAFVDEWWKGGNNSTHDVSGFSMSIPYDNYANEEWWGLVDIDRNATLAYGALKNAFTEHAAGINEITVSEKPMLYPNPAKDKLTITFSQSTNENIVLVISTLSGTQVISEQMIVNGNKIEISLNKYHLTNGMYLLSVIGNTLKFNHLLIKQ